MSIIIDRRLNTGKKSTINRQRFLRRYNNVIRKAVQETINERSITDTDRSDNIHIPKKDLTEPYFHHGKGGQTEHVHPGNKEFHAGDIIERPTGGAGQGQGEGEAGDSGEGIDDFIFQIDRAEFLEYIFEGLALPNLIRKELKDSREFKLKRAGYTTAGSPDRINVVRSLKASHARRIALSGKERKKIRELKRTLREMEVGARNEDSGQIEELKKQIIVLNKQLKRLPFIDDFDLKFNNLVKVPLPSSKAVMFCIMDVSGSMTQNLKNIAKRFFLLTYLFLQRNYEAIDVVFIRHHTDAKECSEEEFFYAKETGGTLVSSALKLTRDIIADRYSPSQWNIYIAQASDGDNWSHDVADCKEILVNHLLPQTQYFAYVELAKHPQNLWHAYQTIEQETPDRFAIQRIKTQNDIYPVFRRLFEQRTESREAYYA